MVLSAVLYRHNTMVPMELVGSSAALAQIALLPLLLCSTDWKAESNPEYVPWRCGTVVRSVHTCVLSVCRTVVLCVVQ